MEANHPDDISQRLVAALADRYRIERALGAGGMATVYLAQDLKHARKVAIKVLKPELAAVLGAERFLTEIRTTANLSHPHILPLFDSGEADTYLYYVMPFIEGESLLDRLERERQLPVEEAVRIASDVADALDYAHRHGVIHRDVKPANILLHDGRPMVADFGIALAISAAGGGRLTETGLSLGTPHYMSPEQASAERDLTARSDVYSLGCVLYEMLAGEPPHTGPTAAAILMRILTEQPRPISELRATVPPHVAATVSKALEKLPADRFESARDFRQALGNPAFQYTRAQVAAAATPKMGGPSAQAAARGWDARSLTLGGTIVALAAAVGWLSLGEPAPVTDRGELVSFQLVDSVPAVGYQPVAGPGGWIGWIEGGMLAARAPGSTDAIRPIGSRATSLATFAPDGEWIAYAQSDGSETVLRKVPARGGSPVTLLETREPILTPHWGDDGWIYFSVLKGGGSFVAGRIRESGGAMDTLLAPSAHIPYYFAKLPGRAALLVGMHTQAATQPSILALDLESGDTATVVERGYHPVWSPSGHLLFARNEGAIFAVPFDLRSLRPTGSPVPVVDSLSEQFPLARFTLSPGGTLVYVAGPGGRTGSGNNLSPKLVGVNGERESIPLPPSIHLDARLSPDGRRLAYIKEDHVWTYDLDLGTHIQLTREGARHHNPVFSPDGQRVAFAGWRPGRPDLDVYVTSASGDAPVERLGGSDEGDYPAQWPDDTTLLVYTQGDRGENILVLRPNGEARPVLRADWSESSPRLSPDGRWIAYVSNETGQEQVYVRRWPSLANRVQVSEGRGAITSNGTSLWAKDSRTLYYHQGGRLIAASVDGSGDTLRVTARRVIADSLYGDLMDLHPDGRRFLFLSRDALSSDSTVRRRLVVVTNWAAQLRDRLGNP